LVARPVVARPVVVVVVVRLEPGRIVAVVVRL
jgi:hypothetical protein